MVCVVDAERFETLSQSIMTLEEQVVFSDWFIVNKCDAVSEESLRTTLNRLKNLKPLAPIFTTSFGKITDEMMRQFMNQNNMVPITFKESKQYQGWGVQGRPKSCIFLPAEPYEISQIEEFFSSIAPYMLRMKGFIKYKQHQNLHVDVVGPHVRLALSNEDPGVEIGVMCIYSPQVDAISLLQEGWQRMSNKISTCIDNV